jgi:hypothetical protein
MCTLETQLAEIRGQFRSISNRALALVTRVGEDLLTARPRPEAWSAAECLTHLKISTEAYLPLWRAAFREGRAAGLEAKAPFRVDLWGRLFVWLLEPPPRLRFPAPQGFLPVDTGPASQVLPAFLASQDGIIEALDQAGSLALDRIKIVSPFSRHVRYSVWASFCVNAAHQRRHLWQAERAAEALGK